MNKLLKIVFILILAISNFGAVYEIDASRNASFHNNLGVNHLKEKYYYGAIKEFEMAIQLNPNTQATGTYYNNLGKTYLKIGYYNLAEKAFNSALEKNSANFEIYQNIVQTYKYQNKLEKELKKALEEKSILAKITAGLILIETGEFEAGINMLDEFCFEEPEMIITKGIKNYISNKVEDKYKI